MTLQLSHDLASVIAPGGTLRAAINVGNPLLAHRDAQGQVGGVSVDLARALAGALGVPIELVVYESAGASVEGVTRDQAHVGFFAIDPVRGAGISFTAPYVIIEGSYMVRGDSLLQRNEEVDAPGRTVVVARGSAYDLFLTRELKLSTLVRAEGSRVVLDTFVAQRCDVAAGIRQQLQDESCRFSGLRMLPGHFMLIRQAMGLPKSRPPQALAALKQFVEQAKVSGFVAQAMKRHGVEGATVAGPEPEPAG